MKKTYLAITLAFLALTISSCSSDDDSSGNDEITFDTLSGKVHGDNFTAMGGIAFYTNEETLSIDITNVEAGCESDNLSYEHYVSVVKVAAAEGTYSTNVAFGKKGETPYNSLQSTVIIDSINDSNVSLRLKVGYGKEEGFDNDDFIVEGAFTVPICQ
ncbi:hypothetical protein [Galbibacter mesophilus]|uniref:hypothetical protein n=1 Tax=Galbibacter mesophilus TaxID=379069 RepID=UPI00191DAB3B|nr:hypothetical protein [Galbibacter mesophilus]MCM5662249.1 hypothetical protein [Galbibacter mesophilus]